MVIIILSFDQMTLVLILISYVKVKEEQVFVS